MAAQTTWARRSKCEKSRVSWTLAAEGTAPGGVPSVATTTWYLVPALPRSVGLGPVSSPPCLARTDEQRCCSSIDDHVPGGALGSRVHHPDQGRHGPGAARPRRSTHPSDGAGWSRKRARRWLAAHATAPPRERRTGAPRPP